MIHWLEDVEPVTSPFWIKKIQGNVEDDEEQCEAPQKSSTEKSWDMNELDQRQEDFEEVFHIPYYPALSK